MEFDFKEIPCPVCGGFSKKFVGRRGGEAHQSGSGVTASIVRCNVCTHQYPSPMPFPRAGLDELYVDHDEYFQLHSVEAKKIGGLTLIHQFETRVGKKGRLLDVGSGAGELLWAAKESGWEADGIDPSREFVEIGNAKFGVNAKVATLEDTEYPSGYFDAVVLSGIIEHLYDPFETLCEIRRVLKDDGWLFFDAPNEDGLYMTIGNLYMKMLGRDWVVTLAPTFPPYHVQGFNPKSLVMLLERARFAPKQLDIVGEISPQTGRLSFRKRFENWSARFINWIGKKMGRGSYMGVWAQKK